MQANARSLESLVKPHEEILIAALLEGEKPLDWYVRKGMPVPTEETWKQMITKVQILMSMVKNTKGYLGEFEHVCVKHELGGRLPLPCWHAESIVYCCKARA
jgi:hypothetical protein